MIEFNLQHASGLDGAKKDFDKVWHRLVDDKGSSRRYTCISNTYAQCMLSVKEVIQLAKLDEELSGHDRHNQSIYQNLARFPGSAGDRRIGFDD